MGGLRPVVAIYSTFFSRAFDQANLDVGLHGLPVVFALDRAGITGDDGPSHHGVLDMALCLRIPGHDHLRPLVGPGAAGHAGHGPRAVRPGRGPLPEDGRPPGASGPGRPGLSRPAGPQRATGRCASWPSARCSRRPRRPRPCSPDEGVEATLWDVRVVRPLDPAMIADAGRHALVVTVEDGIRNGGAGNFIADAIADLNANRQSPPVLILGVPTAYIPHGKADRILGQLGLDGPGIAASIFKVIEWVPQPGDAPEIRLPSSPDVGYSDPGQDGLTDGDAHGSLHFSVGNGSASSEAEVAAVVNGAAVTDGDGAPADEDVTAETPLPAGR